MIAFREVQPEDSSMLQLLLEAFAVLEHRFNIWDRDEAGMLLFSAVEANLAMSGFINRKALENLWRQVDIDPKHSTVPNSQL